MIAIIDDDDAVRHATARLLESRGHEVLSFGSGEAFLGARPERFACALLDMHMPGACGLDVLRALGELDDVPAVLVLTGHADLALAVAAMKLGAVDFLEKPCAPEALLKAIESAPGLQERSNVALATTREARDLVDALSARQRQVLAGIVAGRLNKTIAWELGLSVRTVEAYRAQLFKGLRARGTAAAIRIALAAGIGGGRAPHGSRDYREAAIRSGGRAATAQARGW